MANSQNFTYAPNTKVTVRNSEGHIKDIIAKHGSKDIGIMEFQGRVLIAFHMNGYGVRFTAKVPNKEQDRRALYRGLFLTIKAKLASAAAGIETFEDAFMSNIIIPGGDTVGDDVKPKLTAAYAGDKTVKLLGGF